MVRASKEVRFDSILDVPGAPPCNKVVDEPIAAASGEVLLSVTERSQVRG